MELTLRIAGRLFAQTIWEFLTTPVWWYTKGLVVAATGLANEARDTWVRFGLSIWIKNLFVPMFGQRDVVGRIISFFMRLAQIIGRGIGFAAWIIGLGALLILWLIAPLAITWAAIDAAIRLLA